MCQLGVVGDGLDGCQPTDGHESPVHESPGSAEERETDADEGFVFRHNGRGVGPPRIQQAGRHDGLDDVRAKAVCHVKREPSPDAGPQQQEWPSGDRAPCCEMGYVVDPVVVAHGAPVGDDGVAVSREVRRERFRPEALCQNAERRQHPAVTPAPVQNDHRGCRCGRCRVAVHVERRSVRQRDPVVCGVDERCEEVR